MRLIYGSVTLVYGVFLVVATFLGHRIPLAYLHSENAALITFVIAAVLAMPFITSYTKFGFNTAEGERPSRETKARHAALRQACPIWRFAWYGSMGFIPLAWIGAVTIQTPAHAFFAFSGTISCLTGNWFLFAYPVASRLSQCANK